MLDYCKINDVECIILVEWNRGVTLEKLYKEVISKANPWEKKLIIKKISNQLISALNSLSKHWICHWDIKADNILIDLSEDENFKDTINDDQINLSYFSS